VTRLLVGRPERGDTVGANRLRGDWQAPGSRHGNRSESRSRLNHAPAPPIAAECLARTTSTGGASQARTRFADRRTEPDWLTICRGRPRTLSWEPANSSIVTRCARTGVLLAGVFASGGQLVAGALLTGHDPVSGQVHLGCWCLGEVEECGLVRAASTALIRWAPTVTASLAGSGCSSLCACPMAPAGS
jgi:hypothetical protein